MNQEKKDFPGRLSPPLALAGGLVTVLILGWTDYVTGLEFSFAPFYLVPITCAAWLGGQWNGVIVAIVGSVVWWGADLAGGRPYTAEWIPFVNLATRMVSFIFVAWLVARLRTSANRLEQRVRQRTAELEAQALERRRAQSSHQKSEERFRLFMEHTPAAVFVKDASGRYVYTNAVFEKRFKLQAVGHTHFELFPPETARRIAETDREALNTGQSLHFVDATPLPDGTEGHFLNFKFPFTDESGQRFVGCVALDISERRMLERQLLDVSEREQARIGQDLHDGLCQLLVTAAFDCNSLQQQLADHDKTGAAAAGQLGAVLDQAITQARQVARGLYPVKLETGGLVSALEELSQYISSRHQIRCSLICPDVVPVDDNGAATNLYRIAQEAVMNAARHANASEITIRLMCDDQSLDLEIADNGIGLPEVPQRRGMGLHIMDYRARSIGASLCVEVRAEGGTVVRCSRPNQSKVTAPISDHLAAVPV